MPVSILPSRKKVLVIAVKNYTKVTLFVSIPRVPSQFQLPDMNRAEQYLIKK